MATSTMGVSGGSSNELPEEQPLSGCGSNGAADAAGATFDDICGTVANDLLVYGLCVIDGFLGESTGKAVRHEVLTMPQMSFKDGKLVSSNGKAKTIRSDRIAWVDGKETVYPNIGHLIRKVDDVIMKAKKLSGSSGLGKYEINGRTKAMVACYPGHGSHYVKHVDNPNKDGRRITAIYYLNLNWDIQTCGGLLRIYPEGWNQQVADVAPIFDRAIFFWSDRRNPHEVLPAYSTRYAITLWYFDDVERKEAHRRHNEYRTKPVCVVGNYVQSTIGSVLSSFLKRIINQWFQGQ